MKKIDSLRKIIEMFRSINMQFMNEKNLQLILKAQASLKEHVLNRKCSYCAKKVDDHLFESESEIHDWHSHGMCKNCIDKMLLEQNSDLKWLN